MATDLQAPLDTLYREMFERGVKYCLPAVRLSRAGAVSPSVARWSRLLETTAVWS